MELPQDDAVCVLGPADLRDGDWCALAPAPPEESSKPEPVPSIPVADAMAARTAISQLWEPVASGTAGLTAAQRHWMHKLREGDLEGLAPPKASYVPLRGMEVRAEDMRHAAGYKDRRDSA
eukprot:14571009-Alexandrium_andersonii.AAC.1